MLIIVIIFSFFLSVTSENTNLENVIFPPLPVSVTNTSNQLCQQHSDIYRDSLKNFTLWAYEMWDATAKSPSGVLRGSIYQMGSYEECITANSPFRPQYCLAGMTANIPTEKHTRQDQISLYHSPYENILDKLYPNSDVSQQKRNTIQVGWCIPASCTSQDLQTYLNNYIEDLDFPLKQDNVTFTATVSDMFCSVNEKINLTSADIAFCCVCFILVILVIFVTTYDFYQNEEKPVQKSLLSRLLIAFSARRNFNELTRKDEGDGALSVLYGMRTICIMFIIFDHRTGTYVSSALLNFDYVERQFRAHLAPFIFHGDLFVDSFFLISGLLVSYGLLNQFNKKIINPAFIILLRYVRLTPVYAFVVFYYATLFRFTGDGPLWNVIAGQDSQDCRDNWWTNLLYLNNYINPNHMCMAHAWYLPCDFHYFIIAIGVCLLIHKNKKLGLTSLFFIIIISILIPFSIILAYARPAVLHFYPDFLTAPKSHVDFLLTYTKSHTRATAYFVGMIAGYLYFKVKGTNKHVCRVKSYIILFVSVGSILMSVVCGESFYNPYHKYNALEAASYAGLHRPAFALGSIGILYVASYGHARFVNKILTWSPWIPLSKLTYGVYLIHMNFQLRWAAKVKNPTQISYFEVTSLALSDMCLAFIVSLVMYLLIESPMRKIFRELLMPRKEVPTVEIEAQERVNTSRL